MRFDVKLKALEQEGTDATLEEVNDLAVQMSTALSPYTVR